MSSSQETEEEEHHPATSSCTQTPAQAHGAPLQGPVSVHGPGHGRDQLRRQRRHRSHQRRCGGGSRERGSESRRSADSRSLFFVPLQIRQVGGRAASAGGKVCSLETTWRKSEASRTLPAREAIIVSVLARQPPPVSRLPRRTCVRRGRGVRLKGG